MEQEPKTPTKGEEAQEGRAFPGEHDLARAASVLESLLLVSLQPLSFERIGEILGGLTKQEVREVVRIVRNKYSADASGILVEEVARGIQLRTNPSNQEYVRKLFESRPPRFTRPSLETLAVVAYHQPLTRLQIPRLPPPPPPPPPPRGAARGALRGGKARHAGPGAFPGSGLFRGLWRPGRGGGGACGRTYRGRARGPLRVDHQRAAGRDLGRGAGGGGVENGGRCHRDEAPFACRQGILQVRLVGGALFLRPCRAAFDSLRGPGGGSGPRGAGPGGRLTIPKGLQACPPTG